MGQIVPDGPHFEVHAQNMRGPHIVCTYMPKICLSRYIRKGIYHVCPIFARSITCRMRTHITNNKKNARHWQKLHKVFNSLHTYNTTIEARGLHRVLAPAVSPPCNTLHLIYVQLWRNMYVQWQQWPLLLTLYLHRRNDWRSSRFARGLSLSSEQREMLGGDIRKK